MDKSNADRNIMVFPTLVYREFLRQQLNRLFKNKNRVARQCAQ
ncbi:MAG: hypothetical protein PHY78_07155 [Desulfobacterales bacterium]|nr:hypothetical protein [Desulfobacterales bacterium]